MRYGVQILTFLLATMLTSVALGQDASRPEEPLTRGEVRRWLTVTQDDPELSEEANRDLIAEIERRGVDFALSHEEEWAFGLLEASHELIEAIRDALPAEKRQALLRSAEQERLYATFMANYGRGDLSSRRAALDAGKQFVSRFPSDPKVKDRRSFILLQLPNLERTVRMLERSTTFRRGRN